MHDYNAVLTILCLARFLVFAFCITLKVKRFVPLLCVPKVLDELPGRAILEMIYTVLGGTLNPPHSLIFLSSAAAFTSFLE